MPWSTRRCWAGSILGTPPWWRSKQSPFGVIIPYSSWSGANVVAAVFVARTSRYRRTTCFSYSDGNPYAGERTGTPDHLALPRLRHISILRHNDPPMHHQRTRDFEGRTMGRSVAGGHARQA